MIRLLITPQFTKETSNASFYPSLAADERDDESGNFGCVVRLNRSTSLIYPAVRPSVRSVLLSHASLEQRENKSKNQDQTSLSRSPSHTLPTAMPSALPKLLNDLLPQLTLVLTALSPPAQKSRII